MADNSITNLLRTKRAADADWAERAVIDAINCARLLHLPEFRIDVDPDDPDNGVIVLIGRDPAQVASGRTRDQLRDAILQLL